MDARLIRKIAWGEVLTAWLLRQHRRAEQERQQVWDDCHLAEIEAEQADIAASKPKPEYGVYIAEEPSYLRRSTGQPYETKYRRSTLPEHIRQKCLDCGCDRCLELLEQPWRYVSD